MFAMNHVHGAARQSVPRPQELLAVGLYELLPNYELAYGYCESKKSPFVCVQRGYTITAMSASSVSRCLVHSSWAASKPLYERPLSYQSAEVRE